MSESDRGAIQKAWDYHCWNGDTYSPEHYGFPTFSHYEFKQGVKREDGKVNITEEIDVDFERSNKLVNENINQLLSFADFKAHDKCPISKELRQPAGPQRRAKNYIQRKGSNEA